MVWQIPDAVYTVICAPDDGWRYHLKHAEQFPDIYKLCDVAYCWINIGIYSRCTDPWTLNWIKFTTNEWPCKFPENVHKASHTLLSGTNKFPSALSTSGWNSVQQQTAHRTVTGLWDSWKWAQERSNFSNKHKWYYINTLRTVRVI